MKFSRIILIAILAPSTTAFVLPSRQQIGLQRKQGSPAFMALEDLEAKLLGSQEAKTSPKSIAKPKTVTPPVKSEKPATVTPPPNTVKASPVISPPKAAFKPPSPPSIKVAPPPPPKPVIKSVPVAEVDDLAVVKGIAFGTAPLALGALGVLAAGRDILTKTAARREQIQLEIATREAAMLKKASPPYEVDSDALLGATGFFGAAAVSVALIFANPLSGNFQLPSAPTVSKSISTVTPRLSEAKQPNTADEARAKIRQLQAALLEAKRAEQEAKRAQSSGLAPGRGQVLKKSVEADESSYESLTKKATSEGPKIVTTKEGKKLKKAEKIAEVKAGFAEGEADKALAEAKSKELAKEKAEAVAEKLAKQETIDQALAKSAEKYAVEEKVIAESLVKPGVNTEVLVKAAELEVEAKTAAELLEKKVKEDAIAEAKAAEIAAAAEREAAAAEAKAKEAEEKAAIAEQALLELKAKDAALEKAALEKAKAEAKVVETVSNEVEAVSSPVGGGRVLPKEEVSDDVKAFLKTLKK